MARVLKWTAGVVLLLALVFALLAGGWLISRQRDFQLFGKLVSHVETIEKVVALTFDDGPTPEYTPGVLALLKEKGVKATFFVMGVDAEKNLDQMKAIVADGHELGNHTFNHDDMTFATWDKAKSEVDRTDAQIRAAGHQGEIYFRPPFGKKLVFLPLYLSRTGRTTVMWDVEPESFSEISEDPAKMTQHVLEKVQPGSIIILHVMYKSREATRQALPAIIDGLHAQGYRIVPVRELLALEAKPS